MIRDPLYFDVIAEEFASMMNPFDLKTRMQWFDRKLEKLVLKERTVLDVGCGLG